jgi:putative transposase
LKKTLLAPHHSRRIFHARRVPNYRRARVPGGTFFFTLTLLDRRRRLLVDHIDELSVAFRALRAIHPFQTKAFVVLPEHMHCIWTLPAGDSDFSTRWRLIKTRFARAIPPREGYSDHRARTGERDVWQRRFWEHQIRDERDFEAHVDYIHFNPVKHGHATAAMEWPHSSFRRYVAAGVYGEGWAANSSVKRMEFE